LNWLNFSFGPDLEERQPELKDFILIPVLEAPSVETEDDIAAVINVNPLV